jgi:ABC-type uncharacterized transport system permease subunit
VRQSLQALTVVLPVVYLAAALLHGMELGGPRAPRVRRLRRACVALLLVLHGSYGVLLGQDLGHLPLTHPWFVVSFVALSMTLLWLALAPLAGTPTPGAFVLGIATILQLCASAGAPLSWAPSRLAASRFFMVHALSAVLAVAALLLSGIFSLLYLLLLGNLRRRRFGVLFEKLPDLERLSRLNRGAAALGFVLLSVGLNLGIWWAHDARIAGFSYLDPKVLPAIVLWLVFGAIGASGVLHILSGRRAAWIAVSATGLLVLAVLVSLVPGGAFHDFH